MKSAVSAALSTTKGGPCLQSFKKARRFTLSNEIRPIMSYVRVLCDCIHILILPCQFVPLVSDLVLTRLRYRNNLEIECSNVDRKALGIHET